MQQNVSEIQALVLWVSRALSSYLGFYQARSYQKLLSNSWPAKPTFCFPFNLERKSNIHQRPEQVTCAVDELGDYNSGCKGSLLR